VHCSCVDAEEKGSSSQSPLFVMHLVALLSEEGSLYFQAQYWVFPAHYVFESMTMSMYHLDYRMVEVGPGSQYYDDLGCNDRLINGRCLVPVNDYVIDAFCK
jgi:hypothetical protein